VNPFWKYCPAILGFIFVLVVLVIVLFKPAWAINIDQRFQALSLVLGRLLFSLQYLYFRSQPFYLVVNRLRFWLTNEATDWNFSIDLHGSGVADPLETAVQCIQQAQQLRPEVWEDGQFSKILNMQGYALRLTLVPECIEELGDEEEEQTVCLQVSNLQLPYRSYQRKLSEEVFPLLERVVKVLKPESEKYALKIGFKSPNPFFGFFVNRLEYPKVTTFQCDFFETVAGKDEAVRVTKDRIEVVTDSLQAAKALSLRYVTFSARAGG